MRDMLHVPFCRVGTLSIDRHDRTKGKKEVTFIYLSNFLEKHAISPKNKAKQKYLPIQKKVFMVNSCMPVTQGGYKPAM